jgi:hypothetical protein
MIIAAIIYVIMQFVKISDVFVVIAHTCWICVHGEFFFLIVVLNENNQTSLEPGLDTGWSKKTGQRGNFQWTLFKT